MTNPVTTKGIGIYEPIYLKSQSLSSESAIPYVHSSNKQFSRWREFRIHVEMYRSRLFKEHWLTGLFSPKFRLKTKITIEEFIRFCTDNCDSDVIFINPFPQLAYFSFNIWMQAEANHPGIVDVSRRLLLDAGVDLEINTTERHNNKILAYSSFWCGNSVFWNSYVGTVLNPLATFIEKNPDAASVTAAMKDTFHTDHAPYLPFITERLFTTFLAQSEGIRICNYPLDPVHYCFNKKEADLFWSMREQVDKSDMLRNYSASLKQSMKAICDLAVNDAKEYFKTHPHPHTGKSIEVY